MCPQRRLTTEWEGETWRPLGGTGRGTGSGVGRWGTAQLGSTPRSVLSLLCNPGLLLSLSELQLPPLSDGGKNSAPFLPCTRVGEAVRTEHGRRAPPGDKPPGSPSAASDLEGLSLRGGPKKGQRWHRQAEATGTQERLTAPPRSRTGCLSGSDSPAQGCRATARVLWQGRRRRAPTAGGRWTRCALRPLWVRDPSLLTGRPASKHPC